MFPRARTELNQQINMAASVALILIGVLARLVPHLPNAAPIGALALYAGARLPRRWAFLIPLAAMAFSDCVLDYWYGVGWPSFGPTRLTIYGTYALIAVLGALPGRDARRLVRVGMSAGASTLFYITTNFAVWANDHEATYPATLAGLVACYVAALPFYGNTLLSDLGGTALLFGLEAPVRRLWERSVRRTRPAEATG
jgi:hypothetical protein